jgi:hypothetical protein
VGVLLSPSKCSVRGMMKQFSLSCAHFRFLTLLTDHQTRVLTTTFIDKT